MNFNEWYVSALTTAVTVLLGFSVFLLKDAYENFKKQRLDDLKKIRELENVIDQSRKELSAFRSASMAEFGGIKEKLKALVDLPREIQAHNINLVRLEEKVRIIALKFESDLGKVIRKD